MENENHNLATIEVIKDIQPIEGADRIDVATVLGFKSVVKKGEYQIGDKIIFVRPDALLKRAEWNKFVWPKDDNNPDGAPIRIICRRFKKTISQGLILPISILQNI